MKTDNFVVNTVINNCNSKQIIINDFEPITIPLCLLQRYMNNKMMIECGIFETEEKVNINDFVYNVLWNIPEKCDKESVPVNVLRARYEFLEKYIVDETGDPDFDNYIKERKSLVFKSSIQHIKIDYIKIIFVYLREHIHKIQNVNGVRLIFNNCESKFIVHLNTHWTTRVDEYCNNDGYINFSHSMQYTQHKSVEVILNRLFSEMLKNKQQLFYPHDKEYIMSLDFPDILKRLLISGGLYKYYSFSEDDACELIQFYKKTFNG